MINLGEATFSVLLADKILEFGVDMSSFREPEGATRGQRMEEEEFLFTAELPVIALSSFFLNEV